MNPDTHIVVISSNAGESMGGEAIKAYQFFQTLSAQHSHLTLLTHARCREELSHLSDERDIRFIEDDRVFLFLWRSRVLRFLVDTYFHWRVRQALPGICLPDGGNVIHYLCPISPVVPRLSPKGYRAVLGPVNGNIGYPPGFKHREGRKSRLVNRFHGPIQSILKLFIPDKKKFQAVLVSGYERTRVSLRRAGVTEERMFNVVDSGISETFVANPPIIHRGRNTRFLCSGRLIDYKGIDLAVRAIAQAPEDCTLDVYGNGENAHAWEQLAKDTGVADRVSFKGWCSHDKLMENMRTYRAYLFPTLAEANGIVMQEAMTIGLPVVTLRWGGPVGLADDSSAIMIEPENETYVVAKLAEAVTRLAGDPEKANEIAGNARKLAEEKFPWSVVTQDWTKHY